MMRTFESPLDRGADNQGLEVAGGTVIYFPHIPGIGRWGSQDPVGFTGHSQFHTGNGLKRGDCQAQGFSHDDLI